MPSSVIKKKKKKPYYFTHGRVTMLIHKKQKIWIITWKTVLKNILFQSCRLLFHQKISFLIFTGWKHSWKSPPLIFCDDLSWVARPLLLPPPPCPPDWNLLVLDSGLRGLVGSLLSWSQEWTGRTERWRSCGAVSPRAPPVRRCPRSRNSSAE